LIATVLPGLKNRFPRWTSPTGLVCAVAIVALTIQRVAIDIPFVGKLLFMIEASSEKPGDNQ
jgi:hypothetical protein